MYDLKVSGGLLVDGTGGRRLLQHADGYTATVVAGRQTRSHGADTGARPGRLVRGRR